METPPDTWAHLHEYFGSEGLPLPIGGKQVSRLQKRLESKPRPVASSSIVSTTETRTAAVTTIAQSSTFQPLNPTPSLSPPDATTRSSTEASQPTDQEPMPGKNDLPRIRASSRLAQQFETTGKKLYYGPPEPPQEESQEVGKATLLYSLLSGRLTFPHIVLCNYSPCSNKCHIGSQQERKTLFHGHLCQPTE